VFKPLVQLALTVVVGTISLSLPVEQAVENSSCGFCMSIEICPELGTQDALCRDSCGDQSFSLGDCGTTAGNYGCYIGQVGWGCSE
jgi:hypothetical protein